VRPPAAAALAALSCPVCHQLHRERAVSDWKNFLSTAQFLSTQIDTMFALIYMMVHWWVLLHCGQTTPTCSKKQQLMDVSRPHKTNYLDRKQLRRLTSHGPMAVLAQGTPWMWWACPKGHVTRHWMQTFCWLCTSFVETLRSTQKGALSLHFRVLWSSL